MKQHHHQFIYEGNDLSEELPSDNANMTAIIAALLAIELEHPGTLRCVLRTAALAAAGFRFVYSVSNRETSLSAQHELAEWLDWFTSQEASNAHN